MKRITNIPIIVEGSFQKISFLKARGFLSELLPLMGERIIDASVLERDVPRISYSGYPNILSVDALLFPDLGIDDTKWAEHIKVVSNDMLRGTGKGVLTYRINLDTIIGIPDIVSDTLTYVLDFNKVEPEEWFWNKLEP